MWRLAKYPTLARVESEGKLEGGTAWPDRGKTLTEHHVAEYHGKVIGFCFVSKSDTLKVSAKGNSRNSTFVQEANTIRED